jgi:hypothetical protein
VAVASHRVNDLILDLARMIGGHPAVEDQAKRGFVVQWRAVHRCLLKHGLLGCYFFLKDANSGIARGFR